MRKGETTMIKMAKWKQFEKLANPDNKGYSRWVLREEWEAIGLTHSNGGDWNRSDGPLAKKYIVEKQYTTQGTRRIAAIRLNGFNSETVRDHTISVSIRSQVVARPSVILYVHSQNECDHKDGRYTDKADTINQFQCLSKAENDAKRQHCKVCRNTGCRFPASRLGYSVDYIEGDKHSDSCVGCYWYDPIQFNKIISQGFKVVI